MSIKELRLESDRRLATVVFVVVLIASVWCGAVVSNDAGFWSLNGLASHVASAVVAMLGLWFVQRARTRAQFSTAGSPVASGHATVTSSGAPRVEPSR